MKNISIILRPSNDKDLTDLLSNLVRWLIKRKKYISFLVEERKRILNIYPILPTSVSFGTKDDLIDRSDLLISLGGDGTLIGLCRKASHTSPPIFSVNMGTLGFITEFSKSNMYEELIHIFNHNYLIKKLSLYSAEVSTQNKKLSTYSFCNDLVVNKNNISRMFSLSIEINKEYITTLEGDGLIVSSPLGSTAYSLAAGGPIIHRSLQSMVITPICPHSLAHRPFVVPDDMTITVKIPKGTDRLALTLDGQEVVELTERSKVSVFKRKHFKGVQLITNKHKSYFRTLREKFIHK